MRKHMVLLLAAVMGLSLLVGCSSNKGDTGNSAAEKTAETEGAGETEKTEDKNGNSNVTLEVEVGWTDDQLSDFEKVLAQYTEETGVKFEVVSVGEDLETQLKFMDYPWLVCFAIQGVSDRFEW